MTTTFIYFGAYLLACVEGWFAVACALLAGPEGKKPTTIYRLDRLFRRRDWTRRCLDAGPQRSAVLTAFIGGWVLLKFAIGWQREKRDDDDEKEVATQSFLALIGGVLSFSIAIAIGIFLNPNALEVWKNATHWLSLHSAPPEVMPARRFPAPWTFEEANHACFIVRDGNRFPVAYVYFESDPGRRTAAKLMTKDEARKVAAGIAKLP
jgi:hypothetical protein